jgi:CheY-like chemotaxis protein
VAHAIELAATDDAIDLPLTDVMMPGLNGPDLAQRVDGPRGIKVLYVSGFPRALVEQDELRSRVAFLAKPFAPQALALKVRACLDA